MNINTIFSHIQTSGNEWGKFHWNTNTCCGAQQIYTHGYMYKEINENVLEKNEREITDNIKFMVRVSSMNFEEKFVS